nr:SRPBCC domain-containing protein [Actinokineospora inagensis]
MRGPDTHTRLDPVGTYEPGLTQDAGWQIGVSRTLAQPLAKVWDFISGPTGLTIWLGPGATLTPTRGSRYTTTTGTTGEVRGYRPQDRIRVTCRPAGWDHVTTIQVTLTANGPKTTLRFHQEWLTNAAERTRQRTHWQSILTHIESALQSTP